MLLVAEAMLRPTHLQARFTPQPARSTPHGNRAKAMKAKPCTSGSTPTKHRWITAAASARKVPSVVGPWSIGANLVPSSSTKRPPGERTKAAKWWFRGGPSRSGQAVCALEAVAAASEAPLSPGSSSKAWPRASGVAPAFARTKPSRGAPSASASQGRALDKAWRDAMVPQALPKSATWRKKNTSDSSERRTPPSPPPRFSCFSCKRLAS
mmetsp:Transcript_67138/g.148757  ORF Transcript_67138/g.148757 Transcript_67138/m.148757 type:complete len:210 (+) Transcript_67138:15-644(+)